MNERPIRICKAKPPARRRAERELYDALRRFEPRIRRAFLAAVATARSAASIRALTRAIESGSVDEVVRAAGVDRLSGALSGAGLAPGERSVRDVLVEAFQAGGVSGMRGLPRAASLAASLDITNPEAVGFLRRYIPNLIVEVSDQTRLAVQEAVTRGFVEGRPLPAIARDVRDSIGLTSAQSRAVANFRRQLETGETSGAMKLPWERRLSAAERQQARSIYLAGGESSTRVDRLVGRYYESLINRRAKNIARTEAHRAHVSGQAELWRQAEEQNLLDASRTRRFWVVTPDDRLRPDHAAVPGMNPDGVGLTEPFDTPVGPVMNPGESGDPSFDINCRCTVALEFVD